MKIKKSKIPIITMVAAMMFSGGMNVFTKGASAGLAILLVGSLRFFGQGIVFSSLLGKSHISNKREYFKNLVPHTLFYLLAIVFWLLALERSQAITVSVIFAIMPLVVYLGAVLFLKEKASFKALVGTFIALIGSIVIVSEPYFTEGETQSIDKLGAVFALIAVVLTALQILVSKRVLKYGDEIPMLAIRSFVIAIALGLVSLKNGDWPQILDANGEVLLYLAGLIFISGSLGHLLFFHALRHVKAQDASSILFLETLFGVIFGVLLLNETFTAFGAIGSLIVLFGILIAHPVHYEHFLRHMSHHPSRWQRVKDWIHKII